MKLSNKWYNGIKFVVTIFLPGVGALYFALAELWHLPNADRVNGSVNALAVFLGLLIGYSTRQFNKSDAQQPDGDLIISEVDGELYPALGVNKDSLAAMVRGKTQITLDIVDKTGEKQKSDPVVNQANMNPSRTPPAS